MKRHVRCPAIRLIGIISLCLNMGALAHADSTLLMKVDIGNKIVSCDASVQQNREHIAKVLREGTELSVSWKINVSAIRKYWLNRTVATVVVKRRVVPDLVSRSWQLIDMTSGISQRTFSLKRAMQFLTHLDYFPVIDRSLLTPTRRYRMSININETEGDTKRSWVSTWLGFSSMKTSAEFTLP